MAPARQPCSISSPDSSALIAALFGFGGIAAGAAGIAKILFVVFVILAVAAFLFGRNRGV